MTLPAQVRHQQRVEELCAASVRAVAGDRELHFRAGRLLRGEEPFPAHAPHLRPAPDEDFGSFRGAADGLALRRLHSDADLHQRLRPEDEVARLVFDMLEQYRVESLAPRELRGLVSNLRHRHATWSRAFHHSGLTESATGILLYTVAQICRSRVTGEQVLAETEDLLEATRFGLVPLIGQDLAGLRRTRHDQSAFATHALGIAVQVAALVATAAADVEESTSRARHAFSLFTEPDDLDEALAVATSGRSKVLDDSADGYRVFTRSYDVEREPATQVRPALLAELRSDLDRRVSAQGVNVPRLARELRALLAEPTRDGWDSGQEHGLIDGRLLGQLITTPTEHRLFRTEREEPACDALVTFLLDCSGSMRRHRETLSMIVDVLSRAMDLAGVSNEVLGYTTGAWNGGRPLREWRRAGRPPHPGRLNEVSHLVLKDAQTPWRRARRGIAALLDESIYREGVDGEAVTWACTRMRARPESRRLLVVVSDGSPMDTATNLANDPHYLDHHLRDVVHREEAAGSVRIFGLGVGLDLSPYYERCHALDLDRDRGNDLFREILDLLADRRHR